MKQKRRVAAKETGAVERRDYRKHALPAALLLAMLLAYSNCFEGQFLMDNAEMIRDTRIHSVTAEHLNRMLTQRYWEGMGDQLYRPLSTLTYVFNYAVLGNGTNPAGYHWFNLAVHGTNMLLVYWLGLAVFRRDTAALALSALWGLHPVLVESVTNIIGRSDMLAACGVLGALLAHRKASHAAGGRKAAWVATAALATAIGMFSKESAIVVLAVVVLWDVAFEREVAWRARLAGYVAVAVPCIAYLCVRAVVLADEPWMPTRFVDNPLAGAGFWTARVTAVKVIGKYVALLVWPASLSSDYSYNEIPLFGWRLTSWEDWKAVLALAGCAAGAVLAVWSWRRNRALFFFLSLFAVALAPVSNLIVVIGTIMGERLVYLPAVGFFGCVACAVLAAEQRFGAPAMRAAVAAAVLLLAARTWGRNADWHDPARFWASARAGAPGSYKTVLADAVNRPTVGDAASMKGVEQALAILHGLPDDRNVAFAYVQAGTFYRMIGERTAARQGAAAAEAWYRRSVEALERAERIELAQDEVVKRVNAERGRQGVVSGRTVGLRELGRGYVKLGDSARAIAAYERGRLVTADPELLEELGMLYRAQGDLRRAAQRMVEALLLDANRAGVMAQLVDLYSRIDAGGCSVTREAGGASLNPACPLVHEDICAGSANVIAVYARQGQEWEAASFRRTAERDLGCAVAAGR